MKKLLMVIPILLLLGGCANDFSTESSGQSNATNTTKMSNNIVSSKLLKNEEYYYAGTLSTLNTIRKGEDSFLVFDDNYIFDWYYNSGSTFEVTIYAQYSIIGDKLFYSDIWVRGNRISKTGINYGDKEVHKELILEYENYLQTHTYDAGYILYGDIDSGMVFLYQDKMIYVTYNVAQQLGLAK